MNTSIQRYFMWTFGILMMVTLAVFLMLYQSSPGPLAAPHAEAVPGNAIKTCAQCHAADGLAAGCLKCHEEIAAQLKAGEGYHAYLEKQHPASCGTCHPDHHGAGFPLISELSWPGRDPASFDHPHVEFTLAGSHKELECEACHTETSYLGLQQKCRTCHEDVHGSGEATRACETCHDQNQFKPAAFFDHNEYFKLEGPHVKAACAACHEGEGAEFGAVKGRRCIDCHESPHRFESDAAKGCAACHLAADEKWNEGSRGIDIRFHARFGFELEAAHAKVECSKCHAPGEPYATRYPDPSRKNDQCSGCHTDPHGGQFAKRHATCSACHSVERFTPSGYGAARHADIYPLKGSHRAVACIQCHAVDSKSGVRSFVGTATACKACHENPHGNQFDKELKSGDCTTCHLPDVSTFEIKKYKHSDMRAFFMGKGHAAASCKQCHKPAVRYESTPTDCASCHKDIHRGQFKQNGQTRCEQCHGSFNTWKADRFSHESDTTFSLAGAHSKVDCKACHLPAPQKDGTAVVQYRPLTKRCEDCHGFVPK